MFSHTDMMAIGNTESYYLNTSASSAYVSYRTSTGILYQTYKTVTAINSGLGAKATFPVIGKTTYDNLGNPTVYTVNRGYLKASVYREGHYYNNLGMTGAYGHSQITATPSVSLSLSGVSVTITFSASVTKLGEASAYL
ncbi:MAG: hypothetical protein IJ744_04915 [Lachnospiraceae bacterium]|nr:hypothetical protein [Lachnospiraceae bacterium]